LIGWMDSRFVTNLSICECIDTIFIYDCFVSEGNEDQCNWRRKESDDQ